MTLSVDTVGADGLVLENTSISHNYFNSLVDIDYTEDDIDGSNDHLENVPATAFPKQSRGEICSS